MIDTAAIAKLKAEMLVAWSHTEEELQQNEGIAKFESASIPRRPRAGLAIGHSINKKNKTVRLEFRVTAAKGPNYDRACKLVAKAKAEGIDAILRIFRKPTIPLIEEPRGTVGASICGRYRPLHIGASVAHEDGVAGTLGAFVGLEEGGIGIISCAHVLARARGKKRKRINKGDPIHQPGWPDQNPVLAANRIGQLTGLFTPFIKEQANNLDAAVGRLNEDQKHIGNVIPDLPIVPTAFRGRAVGKPLPPDVLETETRVAKLGRTTGWSEAIVSALVIENLTVAIGSHEYTFSGVYELQWIKKGQEEVPFAAPGDSGSLVFTLEGLHPIGLHFASTPELGGVSTSYVVPWPEIDNIFHVKLI